MKSQLVCLAIATLALYLAESDGYDGWEKTWRRKWLTPGQERKARKRMNDALDGLDDERKDFLAKEQTLENKYSLVEFRTSPIKQRLASLCRLFTVRPVRTGQKVTFSGHRTCTCFFVKPDVVMTDAHCIFPLDLVESDQGNEEWVPVDVRPEDGYVTFVVRLYGVEAENAGAHTITTRAHAQLVKEWWTPDQYGYDRMEVDKEKRRDYMDVAFLKVRRAIPAALHLILTQPEGPLGGKRDAVQCNFFNSPTAIILGYPAAYKEGEVAISVSGTVKRSDGIDDKILFTGDTLGRNWWFTKGSVGSGASGGPIIMGKNSKGMPPECDMGVFGIYQGGFGPNDKLRRNYSPLITKQLVQALNLIAKVPIASNSICDAVTEGVKVIKKCDKSCACGVRTVELSLT